MLPGLLEIEKKLEEKGISGCNSVDVKTENSPERSDYPTLPFWKLKAFTSTPHASSMYQSGLLWHNNLSINSKWHITCVFLFYFKIFMQSTFTYTINLLKPCLFQSSNDTVFSVGLRQPMKSIFEPEEDLNYSDKFMSL